jgi:dihydropteroate synthase
MRAIEWRIGNNVVDLSMRGLIMGVLNVTPDSFSDGGKFFDADSAVARGIEMARQGATIIDIGGESTRPGADSISSEEELRRVIPVIARLRETVNVLISIDTSKSEVANAAIDVGATIVNDVTGGTGDAEMFGVIAKRNAGLIVMHMQGNPRTMQVAPHYVDVVREVTDFFRQQYERALECGVDPMAIAFDPGIGFGKTVAHNFELLRNFEALRVHERPLVVGVSRKSFLGKIVASSAMEDRMAPAVALTALLRSSGANIFRVHDVREHIAALRIAEELRP